jgi:hypothetical protein
VTAYPVWRGPTRIRENPVAAQVGAVLRALGALTDEQLRAVEAAFASPPGEFADAIGSLWALVTAVELRPDLAAELADDLLPIRAPGGSA